MARLCHLCRRNFVKGDKISMLRFPKDEVLCKKWKDFYKINEEDKVDHIYLCLNHFTKKDTIKCGTSGATRALLRPEAFPPSILPRSTPIKQNKTPRKKVILTPLVSKVDTSSELSICSSLMDHMYFRPPDDFKNDDNRNNVKKKIIQRDEQKLSSLKQKRVSFSSFNSIRKNEKTVVIKSRGIQSGIKKLNSPKKLPKKSNDVLDKNANNEMPNDKNIHVLKTGERKVYTPIKKQTTQLLDDNAINENPEKTQKKLTQSGKKKVSPANMEDTYVLLENILDEENLENIKAKLNLSEPTIKKVFSPVKKIKKRSLSETLADNENPNNESQSPNSGEKANRSIRKRRRQSRELLFVDEGDPDYKPFEPIEPEEGKRYALRKRPRINEPLNQTSDDSKQDFGRKVTRTRRGRRKTIDTVNNIVRDRTQSKFALQTPEKKKMTTPKMERKIHEPVDIFAMEKNLNNRQMMSIQLGKKKTSTPKIDKKLFKPVNNFDGKKQLYTSYQTPTKNNSCFVTINKAPDEPVTIYANYGSPEPEDETFCTPKKGNEVYEPVDIFANNEELENKKNKSIEPEGNDSVFLTPDEKCINFEPRYVAEITTMDFNTPSSAQRTIKFVKRWDIEKTKKIDNLQHQVLRLKKNINSLKGILNYLGQQGFIKVQPEISDNEMETSV